MASGHRASRHRASGHRASLHRGSGHRASGHREIGHSVGWSQRKSAGGGVLKVLTFEDLAESIVDGGVHFLGRQDSSWTSLAPRAQEQEN